MSIVERERVEEVVAPREVTVADVLERAADLLGEFGWCQGHAGEDAAGNVYVCDYIMRADRFCAAGALARAQHDLTGNWSHDQHWLYMRAVDAAGEIARFNDTPGRTKAEVVVFLRTAAQKART